MSPSHRWRILKIKSMNKLEWILNLHFHPLWLWQRKYSSTLKRLRFSRCSKGLQALPTSVEVNKQVWMLWIRMHLRKPCVQPKKQDIFQQQTVIHAVFCLLWKYEQNQSSFQEAQEGFDLIDAPDQGWSNSVSSWGMWGFPSGIKTSLQIFR